MNYWLFFSFYFLFSKLTYKAGSVIHDTDIIAIKNPYSNLYNTCFHFQFESFCCFITICFFVFLFWWFIIVFICIIRLRLYWCKHSKRTRKCQFKRRPIYQTDFSIIVPAFFRYFPGNCLLLNIFIFSPLRRLMSFIIRIAGALFLFNVLFISRNSLDALIYPVTSFIILTYWYCCRQLLQKLSPDRLL